MHKRTALVYKVIGAFFLLVGVITLLNVAVALSAVHAVLWQGLGYGIVDILLAYGCFTRGRWVLPAFVLNVGGLLLLLGARWYIGGSFSFVALAVLAAAGIIAIFAYERRTYLHNTLYGRPAAVAFFLVWIVLFIYTFKTIIGL